MPDIIMDDMVDMLGMEVMLMLMEVALIELIMDMDPDPDIVTEAGMLAASVAEVALFSKGEAETAAAKIEE